MPAPTSQLPPAESRLPLPRARSVSHLRTQSTSSIPKPALGLSRKPSIPLRSAAAPPNRPQSVISQPQAQPAAPQAPAAQGRIKALPSRPALHGVTSSMALRPKRTIPTIVPAPASERKIGPKPTVVEKNPSSPSLFTSRNTTAIDRKPSSPTLFTSRNVSSASTTKSLVGYGQPPVDRQIRRVVSRGFVMDAPSPSKTHTPSPTKKSHQAIDSTPLRPLPTSRLVSDTPLMPRLARGMGDIDTLPLIADASFSFGDTSVRGKKSEETEELRAALKASEAALVRIQAERDEARMAEEGLRKAVKEKQWEAVKQAIQDEIERSKEYRAALAAFSAIIISMEGKAADTQTAANNVVQ